MCGPPECRVSSCTDCACVWGRGRRGAARRGGRAGGGGGRAMQGRSPVWTADILSDPSMELSAETRVLVEREGYRGVLSVPIFIKGEPYGGGRSYSGPPPSRSQTGVR